MEKVLEQLAERLGVAVEVLWGALLKQAPVQSLIDLLFALLAVIGLVVFIPRLSRAVDVVKDADFNEEGVAMVRAVGWGALCVGCGTFLLIFTDKVGPVIAGFVNPEYWALHNVLSLLSK